MKSFLRACGLGAAAAMALLIGPLTVQAQEPPYIGTTSLLPALPVPLRDPYYACDGTTRCVDGVVREMTRRWKALDRVCHHDAVFALTYLLTTIEYRRAVEDPAFFADNAFVNNEDRLFADYYFAAEDNWRAGRRAQVPPAWRVAFDAAERQAVSTTGNLLLGMNAHIQRDLPFVLYQLGLVAPDGTSRKPDHDRVNVILNRVGATVTQEIADRYDPAMGGGDSPGGIDAVALNQVVQGWREVAWRNAEALTLAPALLRPKVAWQIELAAEASASAIRTATAYGPLTGDAAARNAWCADRVAYEGETCPDLLADLTADLGDASTCP